MEGESGLINLLHRLYDNHILPISCRLPLEGLTLGENFQTHLAAACLAQENVSSITLTDFSNTCKFLLFLAKFAITIGYCLEEPIKSVRSLSTFVIN